MAVADAFSAMTTTRAYRKGLEWEAALEEIRASVGTQFDPAMARAFLGAAEKRRPKGRAGLRLIGSDDEDSLQSGNPQDMAGKENGKASFEGSELQSSANEPAPQVRSTKG